MPACGHDQSFHFEPGGLRRRRKADIVHGDHVQVVLAEHFPGAVAQGDNLPISNQFTRARHVRVSKTGIGAGVGMSPEDKQRLGWVDEALADHGHKRKISVFTWHYQVAPACQAERYDCRLAG